MHVTGLPGIALKYTREMGEQKLNVGVDLNTEKASAKLKAKVLIKSGDKLIKIEKAHWCFLFVTW